MRIVFLSSQLISQDLLGWRSNITYIDYSLSVLGLRQVVLRGPIAARVVPGLHNRLVCALSGRGDLGLNSLHRNGWSLLVDVGHHINSPRHVIQYTHTYS